MTFVGMIGSIRAMAIGLAKQYGEIFAADELVNEAWMESLRNCHTDPPLIMRAAKMDMLDYIRTHIGRKYYFRNGKRIGGIWKPQYITNIDAGRDEEMAHSNSYFDGEQCDDNLKNLENDELIDVLLSATTTRRATALIYYYLGDNNLVETGAILGKSECHICSMIKQGKKDCRKALEHMELIHAEI